MERITQTHYSDEEFQNSLDFYRKASGESSDLCSVPTNSGEHLDFGSDYDGAKLIKGDFFSCRFIGTSFNGTDGSHSTLFDCSLYSCEITNSNFQYCDFTDSQFIAKDQPFHIKASDFSNSSFVGATLDSLNVEGSNFTSATFENARLNQVYFQKSTIDSSSFCRATLSDMDLSQITLRYCDFSDATLQRVTVKIIDTIQNFGLLKAISRPESKVNITIGAKAHEPQIILAHSAEEYLKRLVPYLHRANLFFPLCNIYLHYFDIDDAVTMLSNGIRFAGHTKDYVLLHNLCKLAAYEGVVGRRQLQELYDQISLNTDTCTMRYNEAQSFIRCMNEARQILIANPKREPTALIRLRTNIQEGDRASLMQLLTSIEEDVAILAPGVSPMVQIEHHSPYDILIAISTTLATLLPIAQLFYYTVSAADKTKDLMKGRTPDTYNGATPEIVELQTQKKVKIGPFQYENSCYKKVIQLSYVVEGAPVTVHTSKLFGDTRKG